MIANDIRKVSLEPRTFRGRFANNADGRNFNRRPTPPGFESQARVRGTRLRLRTIKKDSFALNIEFFPKRKSTNVEINLYATRKYKAGVQGLSFCISIVMFLKADLDRLRFNRKKSFDATTLTLLPAGRCYDLFRLFLDFKALFLWYKSNRRKTSIPKIKNNKLHVTYIVLYFRLIIYYEKRVQTASS